MGAPFFSCIYIIILKEMFYMRKFFRGILDITCIAIASVFAITGCYLLNSIIIYALEIIISFF